MTCPRRDSRQSEPNVGAIHAWQHGLGPVKKKLLTDKSKEERKRDLTTIKQQGDDSREKIRKLFEAGKI